LPVGYTEDIFEALDVQDELQTLYTSGTVFHAFLGEKLPDWKAAAKLVRTIAENYRLPYYTLSPTYSICKEHGYLSGEHFTCPKCGKPAEVYSRITGYYRPVQNWNDGKTQEYQDRKLYDVQGFKKKAFQEEKVEQLGEVPTKIETCQSESQKEQIELKYLFTTKTCPNCKVAKEFLSDVDYQLIDAEEHFDLAKEYGVMQAPTLIIKRGDQIERYVNTSNIKKYAEMKEV
ncbi:MAG: ribonucleoside triphosphate reductase, partial [Clostridiales bacterium]|nr:ribonucleoside triphosphate reductase [Clostridiales bacterium]